MKGTLYLVGTPIGNLEDITLRAIRVLKEVDLIAAEDTRTSSRLMQRYCISTKMVSYHKFNERERAEFLIPQLEAGKNIAVISDAGMPGISDPSEIIVTECIQHDVQVVPIPGPSAITAALAASGLSTDSFSFYGFLPKSLTKCKDLLQKLVNHPETMIFYESPKRVVRTLTLMKEIFGDRMAVIAKELTKIHETFFRGPISTLLENLNEENLKGEFVILVQGGSSPEIPLSEITRALKEQIKAGVSLSDAVKKVAGKYNLNKNQVYEIALGLKKEKK
ncbi:MAG: 16S rRNA (cytidine(1402)-2'-O)-methyltransferase [Candidatus Cloacimonadia bacterium]